MAQRTVKLATIFLLIFVFSTASAFAAIIWDPASSTYNGTAFAAVSQPGVPPGVGMTTTGVPAYGAGFSSPDGKGTVFGFLNAIPSGFGMPEMSQTDISPTVLIAGTSLVLEFTKESTDRVNYIAMVAAGTGLSYEYLSETRFRIHATIVDPVQSASGDVGAAFGIYVDTQTGDTFDYKATVFVTDMHFLNIGAPSEAPNGVAGISADGVNGVEVNFLAFMPQAVLTKFGITDVTQCQGYSDGQQVPAGFTNYGLITDMGFNFDGDIHTQDSVLKLGIVKSDWSKHDIQFGVKQAGPTPTATPSDKTPPRVKVSGGKKKNTSRASMKIRGTVSDTGSGVSKVRYSLGSKKSESAYKDAKLKAGNTKWNFTVSKLKRGKTRTVYVKAQDKAGNKSAPITVKIKRK